PQNSPCGFFVHSFVSSPLLVYLCKNIFNGKYCMPRSPCVRGPRSFDTHAPNESVRSVRRHSSAVGTRSSAKINQCTIRTERHAVVFSPRSPCVRGPTVSNTRFARAAILIAEDRKSVV